jgi:hypothetical protein
MLCLTIRAGEGRMAAWAALALPRLAARFVGWTSGEATG